MAAIRAAIFMSRMLQDFPVTFQWAPTGRGGSTRHRRDADATQAGVKFRQKPAAGGHAVRWLLMLRVCRAAIPGLVHTC